jgi:hypothetical protein
MKVTMLLADFAQVVGGKLYVMGGGWSVTGPAPTPSAIAIKIEVGWNEANRKKSFKVELVDSDFRPFMIATPVGEVPVVLSGEFEVGRPPGLIQGSPLDINLAFSIGPLPLSPATRYTWKMTIDDKSEEGWQVSFSTRPAAPVQPSQL